MDNEGLLDFSPKNVKIITCPLFICLSKPYSKALSRAGVKYSKPRNGGPHWNPNRTGSISRPSQDFGRSPVRAVFMFLFLLTEKAGVGYKPAGAKLPPAVHSPQVYPCRWTWCKRRRRGEVLLSRTSLHGKPAGKSRQWLQILPILLSSHLQRQSKGIPDRSHCSMRYNTAAELQPSLCMFLSQHKQEGRHICINIYGRVLVNRFYLTFLLAKTMQLPAISWHVLSHMDLIVCLRLLAIPSFIFLHPICHLHRCEELWSFSNIPVTATSQRRHIYIAPGEQWFCGGSV